jgi:hypothetical protein
MNLPKMVEVKQMIKQPRLEDPIGEVHKELKRKKLGDKILKGQRIAITAGSRGITNIREILCAVVEEVKAADAKPFIIPSMGSHGGATAHGQVETLRSLGITEESMGCRIVSSMEVEEIGSIGGTPVYVDRNAFNADGIIVVGRVKPHTDFKGIIESGVMKMIAIGLGKQKGAEMIHHNLYEGYHNLLPAAARLIMGKCRIIMGLALLENAHHETAKIIALEPSEIEAAELKLLEEAKALLARLPFKEIDLLIVEEIGKNISGVGMDTNVTGRFWMPGESDPASPRINKIVVLDLTPETEGNAIGIGLADLTTRRLVDKINYESTFVNCLTQGSCDTGKTPIWLPNDRDAITTALRIIGPIDSAKARVVRIKNTMELDHLWISCSLLEEVNRSPEVARLLHVESDPKEMQFDVLGTLIR